MTDLPQWRSDYVLIALIIFFTLAVLTRRGPLGSLVYRLGAYLNGVVAETSLGEGNRPSHNQDDTQVLKYKQIFPPSSRERLLHLVGRERADYKSVFKNGNVSQAEQAKNVIPLAADWRSCGPSTLTPTGISMEEVQTLGDFPDYAELTGVPMPRPYRAFKLESAIHRPYRPFRWAYHQTMSLIKLDTDWWLELEQTYEETIAYRQSLFRDFGKLVLDHLPGSELAAKETMEMALQFYCARYPQYFSLVRDSAEGWIFRNSILKTDTVIKDHHPLHVLLNNVAEDFALMLRNPDDGCYYFRGGVICSSLGWNLGSKLGMKLRDIHEPVPDYKAKMDFSMDRYFSKMPTNSPIQRGSWGLEIDRPLFMVPGDPDEALRLKQDPEIGLDRIHLRVDWQTLRRMPLSGAVVFNFKAVFTPLIELRDEPFVPALVRKVLREGNRDIITYKSTWHTEHVVLPALDHWCEEQIANGLVPADWEVATLAESPMYPGWEEKWHRQQGF